MDFFLMIQSLLRLFVIIKIPEMTLGDVLKGTEDYLMPFKSCYCRAVANSIPRTNKELPQIKLLMGIEAKHIIKWCKAIARTRKEDMKLRVAIDTYFNKARLLLDEVEVEKTWQLMLISGMFHSYQPFLQCLHSCLARIWLHVPVFYCFLSLTVLDGAS